MKIGETYKIKPGREGECPAFIDAGGVYIIITDPDRDGDIYYDILDKNKELVAECYGCFEETDLILASDDINHPYSGMIVEDKDDGDKRKILFAGGDAVLMSHSNCFDEGDSMIWTMKEFIHDFKVADQPEQEEKMIKLSNGKEVSEATILGLLKAAGES